MLEEEKKYLTKCLENFTKIDDKVIKGSDIMLATLTKAVLSIEERLDKETTSTPTLTLRDYFAGCAMCGLAREALMTSYVDTSVGAYKLADAMLKERTK